jgi:chemotaxis protein methyltransferase CheR
MQPQRLTRFFHERAQGDGICHEAGKELKDLITFRQINLMQALPMSGPLDVIFCRNVVIYFDKETQRDLFTRMARLQRPDDLLFLGHSENLFNVSSDYTLIGKTIYRRNDA